MPYHLIFIYITSKYLTLSIYPEQLPVKRGEENFERDSGKSGRQKSRHDLWRDCPKNFGKIGRVADTATGVPRPGAKFDQDAKISKTSLTQKFRKATGHSLGGIFARKSKYQMS
jgi:hypothetical protein